MKFLAWLKSVPWARIGLISLCTFLALVLIAGIFATAYADHLFNQIGRVDPEDDTRQTASEKSSSTSSYTGSTINPDDISSAAPPVDKIEGEDIINIMLVGQDRRPGENYRTRSDAMILVTFNTKNKTITLTSFMRDLYVTIPGHQSNKMNAAYQIGGMALLRETMLVNFGVEVDHFVEVDFNGFEGVINAVGGVDITLTQAEATYLNGLYDWNLTAGKQHLTGKQALAYAQNRTTGGNADFGRTERQRKLLTSIFNSLKHQSLGQLYNLMNTILPMITTDMSNKQIVDYLIDLFPILAGSTMQTQRIPIDGTYSLVWVGSLDVVLPDLEANRQFLLDTLK